MNNFPFKILSLDTNTEGIPPTYPSTGAIKLENGLIYSTGIYDIKSFGWSNLTGVPPYEALGNFGSRNIDIILTKLESVESPI